MRIEIPDIGKLEDLKEKIGEGGYEKLHVLSDFDRTLTYGSVKGIKTPSIISILRDGSHLTEDYAEKAHALFNHYHPIETDPSIPLAEKKKAMREWWVTHNRLLIKSGLRKSDLEDIVKNGHVEFRKGVPEFLDFLVEHNIPLVILSASGCGDAIQMYFQKIGKDYQNIHYVTNQFNWDERGRALSAKEPIIHSMNKDETILKEIPTLYKIIKDRKNVILLGDHVGDLGMIEGFDYDSLIKVGFLNFEYNKFRDDFRSHFDIFLEGDGDFDAVNQLMQDLNQTKDQ